MPGPIGADEINIFTPIHEVYPLIDPAPLYASKAFKGSVVLITGGARGIGAAISTAFARAGADLVLVGRGRAAIDAFSEELAKEIPGVRIQPVTGDISQPEVAKEAVQAAVSTFGKLDIVVANAAIADGSTALIADQDPLKWWYSQEVNVRGTYSIIHAALPELQKTRGQIVATSSASAHVRLPNMSDYCISKHTVNRLIEHVSIEYPDIKTYAVHPGTIGTDGGIELLESKGMRPHFEDTAELPAATILWLANRNAEFLSGRYIHAPWDLNEVVAIKDEIVRDNLLVTKLAGPRKSA